MGKNPSLSTRIVIKTGKGITDMGSLEKLVCLSECINTAETFKTLHNVSEPEPVDTVVASCLVIADCRIAETALFEMKGRKVENLRLVPLFVKLG